MRRASRLSSLFSLAMSLGLLSIAGVNLALGDRSLFTLLALVLSLFLLDSALTRLLAAARAPIEVGVSTEAVHVRALGSLWGRRPLGRAVVRLREEAIPWSRITDVRFTSIAPKPDTLTLTLSDGTVRSIQGVLPAIATEVKLAWLEASARDRGPRRNAPGAVRAPNAARDVPQDLLPTHSPQYWNPAERAPVAEDPGDGAPRPLDFADVAGPRPAWGYTRPSEGEAAPDPRYREPPPTPRPFVWHFIPGAGTHLGGAFLLAVLVLAGIAITRLAADTLLSLAGKPSDPWTANLVGLAAGALLAAVVWRLARGELVGEIAGSVIFLPAFDRTRSEIIATLRDAGASLGAGVARERRSRGRLVVRWPSAHTRAIILQPSPDTRAIVLRTVGRANFVLHSRLKGAILEKLRGPGPGR